MKSALLLVALLVSFSQSSFAWDPLGHRTVAVIAQSQLTPQARQAVNQILNGEDFVAASTWADEIRGSKEWSQTGPYHYTSIEDGSTYLKHLASISHAEQQRGDVVMAILKAAQVLRSSRASMIEKNYALKFMIHFVGDIHQPLHVGRSGDAGGNAETVNWFGKTYKLHQLWDGVIFQTAHAKELRSLSLQAQTVWMAHYLMTTYSRAKGYFDLDQWMQDSFSLRSLVYDSYMKDNTTYLNTVLVPQEKQLLDGGLDLAAALNSIFGGEVQTQSEANLVGKINSTIGADINTMISLSPKKALTTN